MKKALAIVLAAGFVVGSYATDARVVVMGRHSAFYRDEVSIFRNPADISLYPNMLYGSYGWLKPDTATSSQSYQNVYPQDPFFGALMSYRFSEEENGPMLSLGVFLNRRDDVLTGLLEQGKNDSVTHLHDPTKPNESYAHKYNQLEQPVGKIDVVVGYDLGNGLAVGLGAYGAYQRIDIEDNMVALTSVLKGTLGINWNLEQGLDFEASVNGGIISGFSSVDSSESSYSERYDNKLRSNVADGDFFWRGDVRFFSAVPAINGSFVPQVSLEFMNFDRANRLDLTGGVGINMNIDRGFFWAGVQGLYTELTVSGQNGNTESSIGGRFSFGIERNIMWDWFLIRVGGQKEIRNVSIGSGFSRWEENSPGFEKFGAENGADGDLVSLGFGLNVDNRLRIDFVAAEDLPYTFTNLVSGNKSHLFNRVSATYRF